MVSYRGQAIKPCYVLSAALNLVVPYVVCGRVVRRAVFIFVVVERVRVEIVYHYRADVGGRLADVNVVYIYVNLLTVVFLDFKRVM